MSAGEEPGSPTGNSADEYGISEGIKEVPARVDVEKLMRRAEEPSVMATEPPPAPPRWPMFSGAFTFPFYAQTVAHWVLISIGLIITMLLLALLLSIGAKAGLLGPRTLGPPVVAAGILTLGYAFSCCRKIIEDTSAGWNSLDISISADWKEWIWDYAYVTTLLLEAAVVGYGVRLLCFCESWTPLAVTAFVVFPVILLSSLVAEGAWVPLGILPVLRTMISRCRYWSLFYIETVAMALVWMGATVGGLRGLRISPWVVPFYSGPLLAAGMLIYARLVGRLLSCIGDEIEAALQSNKGIDED